MKTEEGVRSGLEIADSQRSVKKSEGLRSPESVGKGASGFGDAVAWPCSARDCAGNGLARGYASVSEGALGVRPRFGSRVFDHLAGCSFTEHTLTDGSPCARHYSRGWAYSRVILDWSLDPSECHFFIHTAAGLDDYKVTEIPSSCQI